MSKKIYLDVNGLIHCPRGVSDKRRNELIDALTDVVEKFGWTWGCVFTRLTEEEMGAGAKKASR